MGRAYVIGAGLAGLAAALSLSRDGRPVTLIEATRRAGGRCRSFHDETLGCVIDNGNHLVMSGNRAAMAFLDEVGARDRLVGPARAEYPFVDLASGRRWSVRPNRGPLPWWVLLPGRGVPGATPLSFLSAWRLLAARPGESVADVLETDGPLYRGLWEPLTVAAINAPAERAAAVLLKAVVQETFLRGGGACRPLIARESLAHSFIDPAVDTLARRGVELRFGMRVQAMDVRGARVNALTVGEETLPLADGDSAILAVPPWDAVALRPGLTVPPAGEPIVNVHFRLPRAPLGAGHVGLTGVIGGTAQWIFVRGDVVSITISAAAEEAQLEAEEIAARCWRDVQRVLGLADPLPPWRVVKEKRATFAQDPDAVASRPDPATVVVNLFLAGDWTDTGLPATIEGAIRSGRRAAALAAGHKGAAT
jgi:squalene-associated FAD-dependent desaturase